MRIRMLYTAEPPQDELDFPVPFLRPEDQLIASMRTTEMNSPS